MTTTVYVSATDIAHNKRDGKNRPVIIVRRDYGTPEEQVIRCHGVEIHGPSRLVYRPDSRVHGGAAVWVETEGEVVTSERA